MDTVKQCVYGHGDYEFHVIDLTVKVKLVPESNQGFTCDWIWVEPLCESIIATKEALLRFTVVLFFGQANF